MTKTLPRYIYTALLSGVIVGMFLFFEWVNTGTLYASYLRLSEYRRLHPEFIPSERFLTIMSAGHRTTYADSIWISLIQYVGDSIGDHGYDAFAPTLLDRIYALHPKFIKPYEFSMLLLPTISSTDTSTGANIKRVQVRTALDTLESHLSNFCDMDKIATIRQVRRIPELWENPELANPCRSATIPYYMAFHYYNDLSMSRKAKDYYKVAAANTDSPLAARYLIGLMDGENGDYLTAAFSLVSIATEGQDDEQGTCMEHSVEVTKILAKSLSVKKITQEDIETIMRIEKDLYDTRKEKKQDTPSIDCREYLERAIKQSYLAYISEQGKLMEQTTGKRPRNSDDLRDAGFLPIYPKISDTPTYRYFYIPTTNVWQYTIPEYVPIGLR